MKKPNKKYTSIYVFMAVMLLIILGCTGYNDSTYKDVGNYTLVVSKNGKHSFVFNYNWSGDPTDNVIAFPATDGAKAEVEKVGGFIGIGVPCPFDIKVENGVRCESLNPDDYEFPVSFEDMLFEMKIGKDISDFYSALPVCASSEAYGYTGVEQPDGSMIFYRFLVTVDCDPANETFYSKDGILYVTKDNSQVELPYESTIAQLDSEALNGSETDSTEAEIMSVRENESYDPMEPMAVMVLSLDERSFSVDLSDNPIADGIWEKVKTDAPELSFTDDGDSGKVADLPWEIAPENDFEEMTAEAGDVLFLNGNRICICYGEKTGNFIKIGEIYSSGEEMKEFFGGEDDVKGRLYLEWTE